MRPIFILTAALTLAGCLMEPETKVIHREYEVPVSCLQSPDSTVYTDTSEAEHFSCRLNPNGATP